MTTMYEDETGFSRFIRRLFQPENHWWHESARFRLPSNLAGASFDASAEVFWDDRAPRNGHGDPAAPAVAHVRAVATEIAETHSVLDGATVEHLMNVRLADPQPVPGRPGLRVYANVRLMVDAESRDAAKEHERYRAKVENWRMLRDQVLADPVMACVWWLDDHPERLQALPQMDSAFERLAALTVAGAGSGSDLVRVAQLLQRFVTGLEAVDRQRLVEAIGYVMANYGRQDLADELKAS